MTDQTSADKSMARKTTRRQLTTILLVIAVVLLTGAMTMVLFFLFFEWGIGYFVLPVLALCVAMLVVFAAQLSASKKINESFRQELSKEIAIRLERTEQNISDLLSIRVIPLNNREAIIGAIAELLESAAERSSAQKHTDYGAHHREAVIFFGASAVLSSGDGHKSSSDEHHASAFEKYVAALSLAEKSGVAIQRFVRLFGPNNFPERSKDIRDGYISWLKAQKRNMQNDASYTYSLMDAKRAPRWKAIRSSIISTDRFIDILGDGESGFLVVGKEFAANQMREARKYILDATSSGNPILAKYDYSKVEELQKHIVEMERLNE